MRCDHGLPHPGAQATNGYARCSCAISRATVISLVMRSRSQKIAARPPCAPFAVDPASMGTRHRLKESIPCSRYPPLPQHGSTPGDPHWVGSLGVLCTATVLTPDLKCSLRNRRQNLGSLGSWQIFGMDRKHELVSCRVADPLPVHLKKTLQPRWPSFRREPPTSSPVPEWTSYIVRSGKRISHDRVAFTGPGALPDLKSAASCLRPLMAAIRRILRGCFFRDECCVD
jgi:hypothetical protein